MLLEVRNLKVYFPVYGGKIFQRRIADIKAVDEVSFGIEKGRIFGLVGESGCGKTTLARAILGLEAKTSGRVLFKGEELDWKEKNSKGLRRKIQTAFQDPSQSLNPRMSVKDTVSEGIEIHNLLQGREKEERIAHLLELVGISPSVKERFPSEFSAGQRQRIAIARSLALDPEFLILDEPVSSLDVSVQKQILDLLLSLREEFGLTYLFVSHDLAVVNMIADEIAVMYLGKIVESGTREQVFQTPLHPYTQALLASAPIPDPEIARSRKAIEISQEVPSAQNIPSGCRFHTRCPILTQECKEREPGLKDKGRGHLVACHKV